jgi:hypothetical protein
MATRPATGLVVKRAWRHAEERAMRSQLAPTESELTPDEVGHQDPVDTDGDSMSGGFVLFSLGPAQPSA